MTKSVFDDVLKKESQWVTLYKRNAGFIAKLNISSSNKNLYKMKVSSSKARTTLILDRQSVSKLNNSVENPPT